MIDPTRITNFAASRAEREEQLLFWYLVAGKRADQTARKLERLLTNLRAEYPHARRPFRLLGRALAEHRLESELRSVGTGKYTLLMRGLPALVRLDVLTCTLKELEAVPGIGPKTARCWLLHTRPNQRYAGLDTHVLRWLGSLGHSVPRSTPTGATYVRLEQTFLGYADHFGLTPADLDLRVWNHYATGAPLAL